MTDTKTEKPATVVDQLAAAQAQVATLTGERDAMATELDALKASCATHEAAIAESKATIEAHVATIAERDASLAAERETHQRTRDQLGVARTALSTPAFAAAARTALAIGSAEGEAQATETAADEPQTSEEAHAAYAKITDHREKQSFRNKYKALLGI
jgi:chromosome segregation ATPase